VRPQDLPQGGVKKVGPRVVEPEPLATRGLHGHRYLLPLPEPAPVHADPVGDDPAPGLGVEDRPLTLARLEAVLESASWPSRMEKIQASDRGTLITLSYCARHPSHRGILWDLGQILE
jgi:hypothetical protein